MSALLIIWDANLVEIRVAINFYLHSSCFKPKLQMQNSFCTSCCYISKVVGFIFGFFPFGLLPPGLWFACFFDGVWFFGLLLFAYILCISVLCLLCFLNWSVSELQEAALSIKAENIQMNSETSSFNYHYRLIRGTRSYRAPLFTVMYWDFIVLKI